MSCRLTPTCAAFHLLLLLCALTASPVAASPKSEDRATVARWLDDKRAWEDLAEISWYLDSEYPEVRANALIAIMKLWDANEARQQPKWIKFKKQAAKNFVRVLADRMPLMNKAYRKSSFDIAFQLHVLDEEMIPLLLFALTDESWFMRERAKSIAGEVLQERDTPWIISTMLGFVERGEFPDTRAQGVQVQINVRRSAATDDALFDLARDHDKAASLLKIWRAAERPLAEIGRETPNLAAVSRAQLETLFNKLISDPDRAATEVAFLLTSTDVRLQKIAGAFAIADPIRIGPSRAIAAGFGMGRALDVNAISSLQLEPISACNEIADFLKATKTTSFERLAVIQTIKAIGIHGDAIALSLNRLSEDADDAVRYAAGELLKRQDIMDEVRVSRLLQDLRNDSPHVRLTAANQFDSLAIESAPITRALVRATASGDMPAREGLLRAIERARAEKKDSLDILKQLASAPDSSDLTSRAYARAALRTIAGAP